MKTFSSLVLVAAAVLSQGCAVTLGRDTSFGAQASQHVKQNLAYEMCPYGTKSSRAQASSRTEVSKDTNVQYRGSEVQVYEEFRGRRSDECLPKPAPVVNAPVAPVPAVKK